MAQRPTDIVLQSAKHVCRNSFTVVSSQSLKSSTVETSFSSGPSCARPKSQWNLWFRSASNLDQNLWSLRAPVPATEAQNLVLVPFRSVSGLSIPIFVRTPPPSALWALRPGIDMRPDSVAGYGCIWGCFKKTSAIPNSNFNHKLVINIEKPWRKLLVMQLDGWDCKCKSIQSNEETQRSVQESSAL